MIGVYFMTKKSDDNQQKILDYVNKQVFDKGYPPSVREICNDVGFKSTSTVHGYLSKLEKAGLIKRDPTKPRAISIISKASATLNTSDDIYPQRELVHVPIVGKVAAGQPILAVENIEDTFPVPIDYVGNSVTFMLRIKGDSMIDAGIFDNDLVLVKQQNEAKNGEIVVALIENEATVKTFYKEAGYVRLQPQNKSLEPIIVKDEIIILGKVVGVFRKL